MQSPHLQHPLNERLIVRRLTAPGVLNRSILQGRYAQLQRSALDHGLSARLQQRGVAASTQTRAGFTWLRAPRIEGATTTELATVEGQPFTSLTVQRASTAQQRSSEPQRPLPGVAGRLLSRAAGAHKPEEFLARRGGTARTLTQSTELLAQLQTRQAGSSNTAVATGLPIAGSGVAALPRSSNASGESGIATALPGAGLVWPDSPMLLQRRVDGGSIVTATANTDAVETMAGATVQAPVLPSHEPLTVAVPPAAAERGQTIARSVQEPPAANASPSSAASASTVVQAAPQLTAAMANDVGVRNAFTVPLVQPLATAAAPAQTVMRRVVANSASELPLNSPANSPATSLSRAVASSNSAGEPGGTAALPGAGLVWPDSPVLLQRKVDGGSIVTATAITDAVETMAGATVQAPVLPSHEPLTIAVPPAAAERGHTIARSVQEPSATNASPSSAASASTVVPVASQLAAAMANDAGVRRAVSVPLVQPMATDAAPAQTVMRAVVATSASELPMISSTSSPVTSLNRSVASSNSAGEPGGTAALPGAGLVRPDFPVLLQRKVESELAVPVVDGSIVPTTVGRAVEPAVGATVQASVLPSHEPLTIAVPPAAAERSHPIARSVQEPSADGLGSELPVIAPTNFGAGRQTNENSAGTSVRRFAASSAAVHRKTAAAPLLMRQVMELSAEILAAESPAVLRHSVTAPPLVATPVAVAPAATRDGLPSIAERTPGASLVPAAMLLRKAVAPVAAGAHRAMPSSSAQPQQLVARQAEATAWSGPEVPAVQPGAPPPVPFDVDWLAEQVGRRLARRLEIERERMGIRQWR